MSSDVTKRALSAGLGVGALALLAPRASADTPFSSFTFPATGAPTARTMPDRLAETKSVKDFGALGDGSTDDTAAIQATVNATRYGIVYFPPGNYRIASPITFNSPNGEFIGMHFRGVGDASGIIGSFPGFLLDRATGVPNRGGIVIENLRFSNSGGGCVRVNQVIMLTIRNCFIQGTGVGIDLGMGGNFSSSIADSHFVGLPRGQIGILSHSNQLTVSNCDFNGWVEGIRASSSLNLVGGRFEMNSVGIVVGQRGDGATWNTGGSIVGTSFEANDIGIHVVAGGTLHVASVSIQGSHFAIRKDGSQGNAHYGMLIEGLNTCTFQAMSAGGFFDQAAIGFHPDGSFARTVFMSVVAQQTASGALWRLPNNTGGLTFIQCNQA
jgi:Pectate lyase superfamily protein